MWICGEENHRIAISPGLFHDELQIFEVPDYLFAMTLQDFSKTMGA